MTQAHAALFDTHAETFAQDVRTNKPGSYLDLVTRIVKLLKISDFDGPDAERITEVDYGDYQGTKVFIIGGQGYQPHTHYYGRVSYGSCSGCDFLCSVVDHYDPTPEDTEIMVKSLVVWAHDFALNLSVMVDAHE